MMSQLLSNTSYVTDWNETLDLVFLRLALDKNDKDFMLVTPSGRHARDFSNDLLKKRFNIGTHRTGLTSQLIINSNFVGNKIPIFSYERATQKVSIALKIWKSIFSELRYFFHRTSYF